VTTSLQPRIGPSCVCVRGYIANLSLRGSCSTSVLSTSKLSCRWCEVMMTNHPRSWYNGFLMSEWDDFVGCGCCAWLLRLVVTCGWYPLRYRPIVGRLSQPPSAHPPSHAAFEAALQRFAPSRSRIFRIRFRIPRVAFP
jgi:hypothetical protein